MDDYIKRLTALKAFMNAEELYDPGWGNKRFSLTDIKEILNGVEPADVRPVKRGEWITPPKNRDYAHLVDFYECPFCGYIEDCLVNYCPNCGAEMEGADNG